jgi:RNA polymerase sigma-70 factor (ECF subfamily)
MPASVLITVPNVPSETFGNTEWWVVQQASHAGETDTDPARSRIYQSYRKPIFRHILRLGYEWHDAEDLTQEFFARVLKRNSLRTASRERGKFRSFLLTLLKRFLADQLDQVRCQKRGGNTRVISLDAGDTEFRRRVEPVNELDPEALSERHWVESLLGNAMLQLELEQASIKKARTFQAVKPLLTDERQVSCGQAAIRLQVPAAYVRVTVHRLRKRLRQLLTEAAVDSGIRPSRIKQELLNVYTERQP